MMFRNRVLDLSIYFFLQQCNDDLQKEINQLRYKMNEPYDELDALEMKYEILEEKYELLEKSKNTGNLFYN